MPAGTVDRIMDSTGACRIDGREDAMLARRVLGPVQARLRAACKQNARNVRTSEQSVTAGNQKL
jgi:hypothetical protein